MKEVMNQRCFNFSVLEKFYLQIANLSVRLICRKLVIPSHQIQPQIVSRTLWTNFNP